MTKRYRERSMVAAIAAVSAIVLADVAPGQQRTPIERGPQQATGGTQIGDHDLAHWVGVSNLVGLEVAALYQEHAQSPEIQQVFAKGAQGARELVNEGKQIAQLLKQGGERQHRRSSGAERE